MFNTFVSPPKVHVSITTPPANAADAARLYGEIRSKAEAEAKQGVVGEVGADACVRVIRFERKGNFEKATETYRWLFAINGRQFDVELTDIELQDMFSRDVACELLDRLAAEVSAKVFGASRKTARVEGLNDAITIAVGGDPAKVRRT